MKKANRILNIIMGVSLGTFIGHGIYVFWDFQTHPQLYAMQSAPWYTSIWVYGVFTLIVLAICFLLKVIFRHFGKKADNNSTEQR